MHWTYLSRIERGNGNPSWTVVSALADRLEVDVEDLIRAARDVPG